MSGATPACGGLAARSISDQKRIAVTGAGELVACGAAVAGTYRQCPAPGCKVEIARCAAHGGDDSAVEIMRRHIERHREAGEMPPAA